MVLVLGLIGCPGGYEGTLFEAGGPPGGADLTRLDKRIFVQGQDRGTAGDAREAGPRPPDAGPCAPEEEITPCSPLTSAECDPGAACYIVRGQHLDCVCPPGSAALRASCNTATDCAPGLTCYSSTGAPPGTCRALCDCSVTTDCFALEGFSPYGLCPEGA